MNKKNKIKIITILIAILLFGITFIIITNNLNNETISVTGNNIANEIKQKENIGVIIPLSGSFANFGSDIQKGIKIYEKNQNNCKFIIEDDSLDPKKSLNAYKKLNELDNIDYFLGGFGPATSQTIYSSQTDNDKNENLFIAISTCTDEFKAYQNMLCNYPSPKYQLEKGIEFTKRMNLKEMYLVVANDEIGELVENILKNSEEKNNYEILGVDKINIKDESYYTTTSKIISAEPDFAYISTLDPTSNFKIVKELKENNFKGKIIIGSDIEENTAKEFENILEEVYFTGITKVEFNNKFQIEYIEKYKEEPNLYSGYGHVFAKTLCELAKNNKKSKNNVINYVNTNTNNLAIKDLSYNSNNEIEMPMKFLQIKDGELIEVYVFE